MTTKTTGYENYHFHTHKNGMYNFISLCGYSLKIIMVLKYTTLKNVMFTVTKTANNLFMGYSLEMPHVIEPTGASSYTLSLPARFKITRTKMFLTAKGIRSALKMPQVTHRRLEPNGLDFHHFIERGNTSNFSIVFLTSQINTAIYTN